MISRRQFLKYVTASAATLGLSQTDLLRIKEVLANGLGTDCSLGYGGGPSPSVIWLSGQACSGCVTSLLNYIADETDPVYELSLVPTVVDSVLGDVEGDGDIDIAEVLLELICNNYNTTVMASAGDLAVKRLFQTRQAGGYVLIIEGSIPKGSPVKERCCIPFRLLGKDRTMYWASRWLAANAAFILAVGTCSSYGGIPAAEGNLTGASSAWEALNYLGKPIVNIPGCPPHPDWIIYPVAYFLAHGSLPPLDETLDHKGRPKLRPTAIYQGLFCQTCERYEIFPDLADLCGAKETSPDYPNGRCLRPVGCNGPYTSADCPTRKWNHFEPQLMDNYPSLFPDKFNNWCAGNNYPCQGCVEPDFPDGRSPFFSPTKNT